MIDSGYGIPEKDQIRLFERFYRSNSDAVQANEGIGLGLYLTKKIVEASGGRIGFTSTEGSGTTFWFTVPIVAAPASDGSSIPNRCIAMAKILVVEDDRLLGKELAAILHEKEFETVWARNSSEAY